MNSANTAVGTGPAISLTKVRETAPALVSRYRSAGISLEKHGLGGHRAAVYLVLDHSGSMKPYYNDGSVQALADRVLGLSANLDDDGTVPVVFFSTDVDAVTDIALDNHRGRIDEIWAGLGHMGKTSYHLAMDAVIDHYLDSGSTAPALVVFQTDGGPINKLAAERYLCKAAKLPCSGSSSASATPAAASSTSCASSTSWPSPPSGRSTTPGTSACGEDPRKVADPELYDRLVAEFPLWLAAAREQGIVR